MKKRTKEILKEPNPMVDWEAVEIVEKAGYKVIAYATMMCEHTFVLGSNELANKAYQELEVEKRVVDGWWYGTESIQEAIDWYENRMKEFGTKVQLYYLQDQKRYIKNRHENT